MIRTTPLSFSYGKDKFRLTIEELDLAPGSTTALIGPSGSGKSTLLQLLAGILTPDQGEVTIAQKELNDLDDALRRNFRLHELGLVFQDFALIQHLNVLENIMVPYLLGNNDMPSDPASFIAEHARRFDFAHLLTQHPDELSHGEAQRVAIARALINDPKVILADEPTGNLDPTNKEEVLQRLLDQNESSQTTLLLVTHDHNLLDAFDQVIDIADLIRHHQK